MGGARNVPRFETDGGGPLTARYQMLNKDGESHVGGKCRRVERCTSQSCV